MLLSSSGNFLLLMASRLHTVPGHVTGSKLVSSSGPSSSIGCLPFSQNRQSLPNYPDIVDNEICFQPTTSETSINELNQNETRLEVVSPGVNNSISPSNNQDVIQVRVGNQDARPVMITDSRQRLSQGNAGNLYPALVEANPPSGSALSGGPGHGRSGQLPPYRQIQTRDINVGVSTRIDPHQSDALPDLLYSHVSAPITPTRPNQHRQVRNNDRRTHGSEHRTRNQTRHRSHESSSSRTRHSRRSRTRSTSSRDSDDGMCKEPCVKCFVKVTSFRWVLVVLSMLGVCCVVTGIVLAALHAAGNSFLFLAIMFIGLGVLLVIVVGLGWKCTPRGHEPLHALFGLGEYRRRRERRGHRTNRTRDGNWYGGMMYPEFQNRRPPPTYMASMQEDQQRRLAFAQQQWVQAGNNPDNCSLPSSPPPSYRSRTSTIHSGIHIAFPQDGTYPNSQPPTYRSQEGRHNRPPLPLVTSEDVTADGTTTDVLPGGDVSFAGPDPGVVNSLQTTTQQNVAQVGNGALRPDQNPSTVESVHQIDSSASQNQTELTHSGGSPSGIYSVSSGLLAVPPSASGIPHMGPVSSSASGTPHMGPVYHSGSGVTLESGAFTSRPSVDHSSVHAVQAGTIGLNSAVNPAGSGLSSLGSNSSTTVGSSSISSSGRIETENTSIQTESVPNEQTSEEQEDQVETSL